MAKIDHALKGSWMELRRDVKIVNYLCSV